jgi:hypothetical protein
LHKVVARISSQNVTEPLSRPADTLSPPERGEGWGEGHLF